MPVMQRSASSVAMQRITNDSYEPFLRTGSSINESRSSRASDTSGSTYSVGSDGLIFSSLVQDNNLMDSETDDGLQDSVATSLIVRDRVREFLEKKPSDRTEEDIEVVMDFMQHMPAFSNMTQSMRRALCAVMELVSVELADTVVLNDGDLLTFWSVVLNGHLQVSQPDGSIQHLHMGDSFGIPLVSSDQRAYHSGIMRTKSIDCQYVLVNQDDFYRILHKGEESITRIEENDELVMVMERRKLEDGREGQLVLRATSDKLVEHLMSHSPAADPTYVDDFLLTYMTFLKSPADITRNISSWFEDPVMREKDYIRELNQRTCDHYSSSCERQSADDNQLVSLSDDFQLFQTLYQFARPPTISDWKMVNYNDKSVSVVTRWVNSSPRDFEAGGNPLMLEFVEKFESLLESHGMEIHLRQLHVARSLHSRRRTVVVSRSSRDQVLFFTIFGGLDMGGGVFVAEIDQDSKPYEAGLRRGDQILEVNNHNFERITHASALQVLRANTHLAVTVRFNVLGLRELQRHPDGASNRFSRKDSSVSSIYRPRPASSDSHANGIVRSASTSKKAHTLNRNYGKDLTASTSKLRRALLKFTLHSRNDGSDPQLSKTSAVAQCTRKDSTLSDGLLIGLSHQSRFASDPDLCSLSTTDSCYDDMNLHDDGAPYHVVKVFRADQSFRYLIVHKETTAREVVMLSLTEFGIADSSYQYSLCEVTFGENGMMKTRQLADQLDNLADRPEMNCRYYLRNNTSMEILVPDEVAANISREMSLSSTGSLLLVRAISSADVAIQLTRRDFEIFRSIEPAEYINDLFELDTHQRRPSAALGRFSELVNEEMFWVATEVCSEVNVIKRMRIIKQFIKIARHCKAGRNFNSMFAILSGLGHGSVVRLKQTWEKLPSKYAKMFEEMQELMDPSRNMSKYRTMLSAHLSQPPVIPFFPLVKKDLTFIHFGNDSRVDGLVNFEKLRMVAKEVRQVTGLARIDLFSSTSAKSFADGLRTDGFYDEKSINGLQASPQKSARSTTASTLNTKKLFEQVQLSRRVRCYLSNLKVINDESKLSQLSLACEPPGKAISKRSDPSDSCMVPVAESDNSMDVIRSPMFGAYSPQSVRKIMQLSDKVRSREKPPGNPSTHCRNALSSGRIVGISSPRIRRVRNQAPPAVDLVVESLSVTGQTPLLRFSSPYRSLKASSLPSNLTGIPVALAASCHALTSSLSDSVRREGSLVAESDSGRSSLASSDNHSISSDISPISSHVTKCVPNPMPSPRLRVYQQVSAGGQNAIRQVTRPSHPPSYYVAVRRNEAGTQPVEKVIEARTELPDYHTATRMLAERRSRLVPNQPLHADHRRKWHSCDKLTASSVLFAAAHYHHNPRVRDVNNDFSSDEDELVSAV